MTEDQYSGNQCFTLILQKLFFAARKSLALPACAIILCLATTLSSQAQTILEKVSVERSSGLTHLELDLSAETSYKMFALENPPRLVIDLRATNSKNALPIKLPEAGPVKALRSSKRNDGAYRIVFDLQHPVAPRILRRPAENQQGQRLIIDLYDSVALRAGNLPEVSISPTAAVSPLPPASTAIEADAVRTPAEKGEAEKLMEEARVALANNEFSTAIRRYTRVIALDDTELKILALEFLGVAREKNGQAAHAKAIYQQFLKQYPQDASASRVQQRLKALLTAASQPRKKLRAVETEQRRRRLDWNSFGGFSQYYRYQDLTLEDDISNDKTRIEIESSLSSDLFYAVRGRNESWDLELRFGAGYLNDFLSGSGDEDRLSELYADIENLDTGHGIRIGRQRGKGAGVLGRFDGMFSTIAFSETYQLHLIYGYPVNSTTDVKINDDRTLYGINFDFGPFNGWEFTPFYVEQHTDTLTERRATGFESRYFDQSKTLFTLIDYDIDFGELNNVLLIGSWRTGEDTTLTTNIDLRKSPVLTLSNAIQGQPETDIDDLALRLSDDELEQLANDRTADSTLISVGINHRLNKYWTIYSNATMTKLSDLPASGGLEALPGTGNEWSYDVQFISNSLLKENDTGIFSLRFFDGSASQRTALNMDFRYPISRYFRINPRFRVDLRHSTNDDTDQWTYKPSLKITYRYKRKYHFEIELGGEWRNRELVGDNEEKSQGLFGTIGYRIDL